MSERDEAVDGGELMAMARRICDVLNGYNCQPPITPESVDLRIVAELCYALGVKMTIDLHPQQRGEEP